MLHILSIIIKILTIIGSLAIFLYGMKLMSEALQRLSGRGMRNIMSKYTSTTFKGILSGTLITGIIQSSSAMTVMLVSFVNAGMLTVGESVGVIMGANIGTTFTAWLVSVLGYGSLKIVSLALPLTALALPLLFSKSSRNKSYAEFIFGFTLLFIGLSLMRDQVPHLDASSPFLYNISQFSSHSRALSVLFFMVFGLLLTVTFQSSSATLTLTIVLATEQWIPFDMAIAMVIGENIGTTSTAFIASLVANNPARRTAMIHVIFNVIGSIWALLLFGVIIRVLDRLLFNWYGVTPENQPSLVPLGLAVFHSGFNVINTILLAGFKGYLVSLASRIIPARGKKKEKYHLTYFDPRVTAISEISLFQVKKEIILMGKHALSMLQIIPDILVDKDQETYERQVKRMEKSEKKMDRMEDEISLYLSRLSESKLSAASMEELQGMFRIIDEIEGIGDSCYKVSQVIKNKNELMLYFIQEQRNNLMEIYRLVESALDLMVHKLAEPFGKGTAEDSRQLEDLINLKRDELKSIHIDNLKEKKYNYQSGLAYIEIITQFEKIGDLVINVAEVLALERSHN